MRRLVRSLIILALGFVTLSGRGEANGFSSLIKGLQKILGKSDNSAMRRSPGSYSDDLSRHPKDLSPPSDAPQPTEKNPLLLQPTESQSNVGAKALISRDINASAGRMRQKLTTRTAAQIYARIDKKIFARNDVLFENFLPIEDPPSPPSSKREVLYLHSGLHRIRDQGEVGSCTAFALIGAMEMLALRKYGRHLDLSENSLWNAQGQLPNFEIAVMAASTIPTNLELFDPYWGADGIQGGAEKKYSYGVLLSLRGASHLTKYSEIAYAFEHGDAVVMSVKETSDALIYAKGDKITGSGKVPGPYGHVMSLLGIAFDPAVPGGGYFLVRNSWGTSWGIYGFGEISFDYCRVHGCQFTKFSELIFFASKDNNHKPSDNLKEIDAVSTAISKPFKEYAKEVFRLIALGKKPDLATLARTRAAWKEEKADVVLSDLLQLFVSDETNEFLKKTLGKYSH